MDIVALTQVRSVFSFALIVRFPLFLRQASNDFWVASPSACLSKAGLITSISLALVLQTIHPDVWHNDRGGLDARFDTTGNDLIGVRSVDGQQWRTMWRAHRHASVVHALLRRWDCVPCRTRDSVRLLTPLGFFAYCRLIFVLFLFVATLKETNSKLKENAISVWWFLVYSSDWSIFPPSLWQLTHKRIGNDIVVLVFREPGGFRLSFFRCNRLIIEQIFGQRHRLIRLASNRISITYSLSLRHWNRLLVKEHWSV